MVISLQPRPPQFALRVGKSLTGHGLFAAQDIPKGRFIVEYWGKLMTADEADLVGGRYLFDIENGNAVDGTNRKNIARYINHGCRPNAETRTVGNRIYIFSIKPIRAGEEIAYDYGKEYFNEFIKPHGCKCASCVKKNGKV